MHDPDTLVWRIRVPLPVRRKKGGFRCIELLEIWHKDPCSDGTDDSCGRHLSDRHVDSGTLQRIINHFDRDWDSVFRSSAGNVYFSGLFCPNGDPHLSVMGIVLNLYRIAAIEVFKWDVKKVNRYLRKNLFDILIFAENPGDSLHDALTRKYEIGCGEVYSSTERSARIYHTARIIYTSILRDIRPWWKHPKWHVHHWRIVVPLFRSWRNRHDTRQCQAASAATERVGAGT